MDGSERPKAHSYRLLEDNHTLTRLLLYITWLVCLLFCYIVLLMLVWNHKAFISFHVSAPLIWAWYTADLLPGTVFSDTSLVGMSQCVLTDRYAEGWDCDATAVFLSTVGVWVGVAFVLPVHISYKSMSRTCPSVQALTDDSPHHKRFNAR